MINSHTKRKLQAIETKKRIYDAAIKLIEQHGFDNVTVEEISKKACVSVGAFYHYFASKNEITYEIFRQIDKHFEDEVSSHLEGNYHQKIMLYFMYYARFVVSQGLIFTKQLYNTENRIFVNYERYLPTLLGKIVKEGQASHEISRDSSPEEIMELLFIFARGIVFDWCLHDSGYDLEASIMKNIDRLLRTFE